MSHPDLQVLSDTSAFAAGIDQSPCNGCDACGTRCTEGVPMLETEFEAVRRFLAGPEGAEARRVELQEKRVPIPGAEEFHYMACRFRDVERARCSIYPVRPLVCRLFGHVEWLPCPIDKIPAPVPGGIEIMQRYGDAPQRTYEEWLAAFEVVPRVGASTGTGEPV
jgi:ferredoxin